MSPVMVVCMQEVLDKRHLEDDDLYVPVYLCCQRRINFLGIESHLERGDGFNGRGEVADRQGKHSPVFDR